MILHYWPFYSWSSRFPLCLCDDRTGLKLYDGGSLPNPGTEGGRLIHVLCSFCRALNGFCTVALTSDKPSSTCLTGSIGLLLYISMFYMFSLCAPPFMLYSCQAGILFIYTVRLFGWLWDKREVGAPLTGLNPQWCFCHWPFQGGTPIFTQYLCTCLMCCALCPDLFSVLGQLYFIFFICLFCLCFWGGCALCVPHILLDFIIYLLV